MATKKIGITCDDWKANKYRKKFIAKGYTFEFDGPMTGRFVGVHLFRVEVDENDFGKETHKIGKIVTELEIELKRSN